MNQEQRARLRELAGKATPGPWYRERDRLERQNCFLVRNDLTDESVCLGFENYNDMDFIASTSPDVLLSLLDQVDELERRLCIATEALVWSKEMFVARDEMNAKVHCSPVRLSPITERVKQALEALSPPAEKEKP